MTTDQAGHKGRQYWCARLFGLRGYRNTALAALLSLGTLAAADVGAQAAFVTLYDFKGGNDGANPYGALVADSNGVLYGTTAYGGTSHMGTVFSLTHVNGSVWQHKVIYSFNGSPDGANPSAGVIIDPKTGALYGTTSSGGVSNGNCSGCGTAFKLTPNATKTVWSETVIYRFKGGANDGALPMARLLEDGDGILYGTTTAGGSKNLGTVFSLTPRTSGVGTYIPAILHIFAGGAEGGVPNPGLIFDKVGTALLGTTSRNGVMTGQCSQDFARLRHCISPEEIGNALEQRDNLSLQGQQ